MAPLAHYIHVGAAEGRFASRLHERMAGDLMRSSRAGLLRGTWQHGRVLIVEGGSGSGDSRLADVADALARHHHLDALVVSVAKGVGEIDLAFARRLVLAEYEEAPEILRASALRLLALSIVSLGPRFALSDTVDVLDVLRTAGVPSYFLHPDEADEALDAHVRDAIQSATRVIFPSSSSFHSAAAALGSFPVNVTLQPPPSSANGNGATAEVEKYVRSILEIAERDAGLFVNGRHPTEDGDRPEPTKRLVIPCSDWAVSGVNASLEAVATELQRRGWEIEVVFTRDREQVLESAGDESNLPGLPFRFLEPDAPGHEGSWRALLAYAEQRAPCILFLAYDFVGNSVAPALSNDVGVVMWAQADDGDYYEQAYRLGRYCNALVCVSERIKEKTVELNPLLAVRASVIHNSSVSEQDLAAVPREPGDTLRLVYTGRLVQYQKRVLDYIQLARELDERDVPYVISLVGTFSPRERSSEIFHERAHAHLDDGRIRLLGRLPRAEILAALDEHDFFVLLSDFEGLPLSVGEALARGCVPVVAEMESGIPEIVTSGENGMIVAGRDYGAWADLLVETWRDRARYTAMSERAIETVRTHLAVEQIAGQFEEVFSEVARELAAGSWTRPASLTWGSHRSWTGDVIPPPSIYRPLKASALR